MLKHAVTNAIITAYECVIMLIGAQLLCGVATELQTSQCSSLGPGQQTHMTVQLEHFFSLIFMWMEMMGTHLFHLCLFLCACKWYHA